MHNPIRKSARKALWELFFAGLVFTPLLALRDQSLGLPDVPAAVTKGLEIAFLVVCGIAALFNVAMIGGVWVHKARGSNDFMPAFGVSLILLATMATFAAMWFGFVPFRAAAIGTASVTGLLFVGRIFRKFGERRAAKRAAKSAKAADAPAKKAPAKKS